MEQDTRIGLAMGILLIGIVGALFFRNEQPSEELPKISDVESLESRIAERPIGPYLSQKSTADQESEAEGPATIPPVPKQPVDLPGPIPLNRQAENPPRSQQTLEVARSLPRATDIFPGSTRPAPLSRVPETTAPQQPVRQQPQPEPQAPIYDEYVVQSGDTLSGIAERFLGSTARYMEIYEMNRDRLRSPHDLRADRAIRVPRRP